MDSWKPKTTREIDPENPFSIYLITNKINGKQYVGQTIMPIMRRWYAHVCRAMNEKNTDSPLGCAIRKYGKENFEIVGIDKANNIDDLNNLEIKYISELNTLSPNGYNIRHGGSNSRMAESSKELLRKSRLGKRASDESRRKMSESQKKRGYIPWNKGKHLPEEMRRKISESEKGRIVSGETRKKLSQIFKGKQMCPMTDEIRKKISETQKKRGIKPPSPVGRKHTPEQKRKFSEKRMGHTVSEETRRKISESLMARNKGKENCYEQLDIDFSVNITG